MDPVALIVAVLEAGLTAPKELPDATAGAYGRFREEVRRRLAERADGELALDRHEADPEAGRELLLAALVQTGAGDDEDLLAAAEAVTEAVHRAGKYAVGVSGARGVQVGDGNTQNTYIIGQYAGRQEDARPTGFTSAARLLSKVTDPFSLEVHSGRGWS